MIRPAPLWFYTLFPEFKTSEFSKKTAKEHGFKKNILLKIIEYRIEENRRNTKLSLDDFLRYAFEAQFLLSYPIHSIIYCPSQVIESTDPPQNGHPLPVLYRGIEGLHPQNHLGLILDQGEAWFLSPEDMANITHFE